MNPQVPNELISAYFDGEVTPEERAAVERLLADNEDAQRELNETARLSALLHSFPREVAPAELAANVLRQTSQIPLPSPSPARRHRWRELRAAVISAVTTAVACLIIVTALDLSSARFTLDGHQAAMPPSATPAASATPELAKSAKMPLFKVQESRAEFGTGAPAPANTQPAKEGPHPDAAAAAADVPSAGVNVASREELQAKKRLSAATDLADVAARMDDRALLESPQIDNFANPQSNGSFVENLNEGRIYNFVPQVADPESTVPVVDVSVIDLDRGVEEFLVVLEKLKIRPLSKKENREAARKAGKAEDEVVVVYVAAPGDRLAAALSHVDEHSDLYAGWTTQLPLPLSDAARQIEPEDLTQARIPPKSGGARDKSTSEGLEEAETEEAQVAVAALMQRNSVQIQALSQQASDRPAAAPARAPRESSPEKQDKVTAARRVMQRDTANEVQVGQGYEVLRVQNSLSQGQPYRFGQNTQGLGNTAFRSRQTGGLQSRMQPQRTDSSDRALRMLFVLHPQSEAALPAPAAKPQ